MQGEKLILPRLLAHFPPALFSLTCAVWIFAEDNNAEDRVCRTRQVFSLLVLGARSFRVIWIK